MDILFVFFVKQKTAYEMRISDWSSDVCSSDLATDAGLDGVLSDLSSGVTGEVHHVDSGYHIVGMMAVEAAPELAERSEERRVGKECVSSVDLGGRRIIKKKQKQSTDMTITPIRH